MGSEGLLRGLTLARLPDPARVKRQDRRERAIFFISLLGYLPFFVILYLGFTLAWSAVSWGDFWGINVLQILVGLLAVISLELRFSGFLRKRAHLRAQTLLALPLRQAARAANEQTAPVVDGQPEPLSATERAPGMAAWGPLQQPLYGAYEVMRAVGWVAFSLGLLFLLIFALILLVPGSQLDETGWHALVIGAVISGVVWVGGILAVFRARRMPRNFEVRADGWHLEWRHLRWWGASRRITGMAWSEARAFYTFDYKQDTGPARLRGAYRVYVLDAEQTALAWMVAAAPDASETGDGGPDDVCRLVAKYTRLPLRNLSAEVERLADRLEDKPARRRKHAPPSLEVLQRAISDHPLASFKWAYLRYVVLLPLVSFGLFAGAAWGVQTYQSSQYERLLAQVRAHQPLYHDSLAAPTGDWPVQSPSAQDPRGYAYVDHAYQLTGDDFTVALAPPVYGDMAVEVTVRLTGGAQTLGNIWVGLALHMDAQGNGLLFQVNPGGDWSIGTFDDSEFHHSGAIQVIKNRLTVIMRGDEYICYANDQFMGIYHSTQFPAGFAGVFLGSPLTTAAFTDFTIYSV